MSKLEPRNFVGTSVVDPSFALAGAIALIAIVPSPFPLNP